MIRPENNRMGYLNFVGTKHSVTELSVPRQAIRMNRSLLDCQFLSRLAPAVNQVDLQGRAADGRRDPAADVL
jgi:hypothetical protein